MTPAPQQTGRPVCTVCIANYNGESLLAECLDSVRGQEGGFDIEIIVHDDRSTDGSVALLKDRYPDVKLMESPDNVGFCIANNRMAAAARGDYILLLNNDAALFPDAIGTLLTIAGSRTRPGILSLPQYDWESGKLVDRGSLLDPFYNPIPNLETEHTEVAYVIGACLWIPRDLWHELGGFPDWMESIAEDMYLGCRARLGGHEVIVARESGYRHRQGSSFGGNRADEKGLSSTYRRRYLSERNKTAVLITCTPTPVAWVLLFIHAALLLFEGACLALAFRGTRALRRIYYPAIRDTVSHLPQLVGIRKQVQASRKIGLLPYFRAFRLRLRKVDLLLNHGFPRLR